MIETTLGSLYPLPALSRFHNPAAYPASVGTTADGYPMQSVVYRQGNQADKQTSSRWQTFQFGPNTLFELLSVTYTLLANTGTTRVLSIHPANVELLGHDDLRDI